MPDTLTSSEALTSSDAFSDFVSGGSDEVSNIHVYEPEDILFFTIDDGVNGEKIYFKTQASETSSTLDASSSSVISLNPNGSDAPNLLAFSTKQGLLYASLTNSDGDQKLVVIPMQGLTAGVVDGLNHMVGLSDDGIDNPAWVGDLTNSRTLILANDTDDSSNHNDFGSIRPHL